MSGVREILTSTKPSPKIVSIPTSTKPILIRHWRSRRCSAGSWLERAWRKLLRSKERSMRSRSDCLRQRRWSWFGKATRSGWGWMRLWWACCLAERLWLKSDLDCRRDWMQSSLVVAVMNKFLRPKKLVIVNHLVLMLLLMLSVLSRY